MKNILSFLLLVLSITTYAQTYNFQLDTPGAIPAGVTQVNGTIQTVSYGGSMTMEAKTVSGNTAVFNMDLFPESDNYSVTWKETYTTDRRSGFILRGSGANSSNPGAKQGYLFQANATATGKPNTVKIYRSNASDYTELVTQNLTAPGANTPRWYRATANGNILTLDYSTDGINFTNLITTTDATYTSGTTQYVIGYGNGVGGSFVDDVQFAPITPIVPGNIYDFEADAQGAQPANVSVANGTVIATSYGGNMTMEAKTITTGNTAVFNMDLFPASANYSVTWKETYTTARRSGFILRGSGSNSVNPGAKTGYLFQASPSAGHVRVYSSNSTGYTQLVEQALAAPGANTPRWYKATANGITLTLDYSTDGTNFTNLITTTDATYTSGTTQYVIGFGNLVGGSFVDDVMYNDLNTNDISITNVDEYQVFQRDASGNADILVEGTYSSSPAGIEARWNGNVTWTTLTKDANGAGTFSGTLSNQTQGQGILEVRFSDNTSITNLKANVGIGDIFIIAGQSNASGRGNTLNAYSHSSLKAALFGNDDNWKNLADATDSNAGQVNAVSSDALAAGSPWPLIATSIMVAENVPVAFVTSAMGGTTALQWQPGANHADPATLYGSMNRRITAIGGKAKAILFFQGESDASGGTAQATYETRLNTIINTVVADFSGIKTMVGQIAENEYAGTDAIRAGQINVSYTNENAILGPAYYDINLGDNLHFKTDTEMAEFARRWYKAIAKAFYSETNGYGPIADKTNIRYNQTSNKIVVPFTDDTSPVIGSSSTVATTSFELENNGSPIAISSLAVVGSTIELTPSTTLNTAQTITLTYASLNDAVNAAIYDNDGLPAENFYDVDVQLTTTWDGSESTDWNTAANWDMGIVPTATDNVIIPNVTNDPTVNEDAATPAVCNNLTIESGAVLTIAAGKALTVSSTLTNNAGTGGLVIQSTSDASTGTGSLQNSTTGVLATVERWMTGDLWHLISPAATGGETVDQFVGTTQNDNLIARKDATKNYALAPYNEGTDSWDYYKTTNTNSTFFGTPGKGYQVLRASVEVSGTETGTGNGNAAYNGIVSFKGTLGAADVSIGITKTVNHFGWNLIGNPYPCAMDVKLFLENAGNVTAIDQSYRAIYVADITNTSTYGYTPVNFVDNPDLKLASGEGFFVKSATGGGTINFTTAMKSHVSSAFKSAVIQNGFNLIAESAGIKMSTSVKYIPQMTAGLDPGWDAGLFYNGEDSPLSLFTRLVEDNGVDFTIQCLPDYDYENMVVPVGIIAQQGATVNFSLADVTVPVGYKVFLEDKVSQKFTRLDEQGSIYTVQINTASNGTDRFFLHTKQDITGIKDGLSNHIVVIPMPQHSIIRVSGLVNLPAQATVYDMNGRTIAIKKLTSSNDNEIQLQGVSNGIYLIKIKSDKQTTQSKFNWSL